MTAFLPLAHRWPSSMRKREDYFADVLRCASNVHEDFG